MISETNLLIVGLVGSTGSPNEMFCFYKGSLNLHFLFLALVFFKYVHIFKGQDSKVLFTLST